MGSGNDQARKTRFGIAIMRLRDRVFRIDDLSLRLVKAGAFRRAVKWQLQVFEEKTPDRSAQRQPWRQPWRRPQ